MTGIHNDDDDSPVVTDSLLDLLLHCLSCHLNWSSVFKSFHPFIHSPMTETTVSILNLHSSVDFKSFTHSDHKKRITLCCSSTVQVDSGGPCCTSYSAGSYCSIVTALHLLTPTCRVLLEKLTGLQLVKKFPAFHGTRRLITALTSVRQLSLSWASPIHSIYPHPTSWRSVLILSEYSEDDAEKQ